MTEDFTPPPIFPNQRTLADARLGEALRKAVPEIPEIHRTGKRMETENDVEQPSPNRFRTDLEVSEPMFLKDDDGIGYRVLGTGNLHPGFRTEDGPHEGRQFKSGKLVRTCILKGVIRCPGDEEMRCLFGIQTLPGCAVNLRVSFPGGVCIAGRFLMTDLDTPNTWDPEDSSHLAWYVRFMSRSAFVKFDSGHFLGAGSDATI